jgi:hypothetical protein
MKNAMNAGNAIIELKKFGILGSVIKQKRVTNPCNS